MTTQWQFISLLVVVCGLIHCNDGACNVTCTTDFISVLNCSDSDLTGKASCDVFVNCRDEVCTAEQNCTIKSSQSWCIMESDDLEIVMAVDTSCSITATQLNQQGNMEKPAAITHFTLMKSVKPKQPFNLTVGKTNDGFNLTWDVAYTDHFLLTDLIYRVRLRDKSVTEQNEQLFTFQGNPFFKIVNDELLPGRMYVADVQVAVNPDVFKSLWSEWSNSVEWTSIAEESQIHYYAALLLIPMALVMVFLAKEKISIKMITVLHIPSPHDFFKPLYQNYQGDFKKWVEPPLILSKHDAYEKSSTLQVFGEKQLGEGSEELSDGSNSQRDLSSQNTRKFHFHGSNSDSVTHSGGHISIDTVTVSGQEGLLDGFVDDQPEVRGAGLGGLDWHHQDLENMEQASLSSFSSSKQSDDGYPQVQLDLDTIDSGFMDAECSSPLAFNESELMDSVSPEITGSSHSNYVKQWVTFSTLQVDAQSDGN